MSDESKHITVKCKILSVEQSSKHHRFVCRNLDTNRKFKVYTKYEYFYNDFKQSNNGLNLDYWYEGGFRQVINKLIEFKTELIWIDPAEGDNGPHLTKSDDKFCNWLAQHHITHSDHYLCDFNDDCSNWEDEKFPDYNTDSPIED